ncbi:MAG: methylenetetrahydrofolate reductase C-terminal domain-containing protein [Candidatus Omnitrophica bacterium]|nr:methylenetetrahydrofolate reductase C-terminal domain-containing protein [Candidatus Omnitrophota bacterium]
MIITETKPLTEIIDSLKKYRAIFLVGCGECATSCKTGGTDEVAAMKALLEKEGKTVTGSCIPGAPCTAAQVKAEFAKNMKSLREAEAVLVLACGLGVQSVKENNRLNHPAIPACNTICGAVIDSKGDFWERCSLCGECVLADTGGICPVTLCAKGLLNGPCGGMNKGKCEVDKDKDCAWVLIYRELEQRKDAAALQSIRAPRDHQKALKPHHKTLTHGTASV